MKLILENIGKSYEGRILFSGINLQLEPNDKLAVTGQNGSGKTTLLKIISSFAKPSYGEIYFENNSERKSLSHLDSTFAGIQMQLPQDLTVSELIHYHFEHRNAIKVEYIQNIQEIFPIQSMGLKVSSLSAGWYNRLKLMLTLLTKSPIVILDEPFSNLDTDGIEQMKSQIIKHSQNRILIIAGNRTEEIDFCNKSMLITNSN